MKIKFLYVVFLGVGLLSANSNINNSGTFVNNGTITNNLVHKYEKEKAIFDLRIKSLATDIMNNAGQQNQKEKIAVLNAVNHVNNFNISRKEKREKCIEHSVSIGIVKAGLSFSRKECTNIFR